MPLVEALARDGALRFRRHDEARRHARGDRGGRVDDQRRARVAVQPGALEVVAESGAAVCLMHMQGEPRTMQRAPAYGDVVAEIRAFLQRARGSVHRCRHRARPDRHRSGFWLRQDGRA